LDGNIKAYLFPLKINVGNIDEDVGKKEPSYIATGNIN
jgi:hypothetical protein